jgi:hypothetical protein
MLGGKLGIDPGAKPGGAKPGVMAGADDCSEKLGVG